MTILLAGVTTFFCIVAGTALMFLRACYKLVTAMIEYYSKK